MARDLLRFDLALEGGRLLADSTRQAMFTVRRGNYALGWQIITAFGKHLRVTLSLEPHGAGQALAQRELVLAIQNALDARRQRIVPSGSSVNAVKWGALLAQAVLILITIAMVHCDNPMANRIILGVFATGAAAAVLLIAAHSRPFSGAIAIRPALLQQVMPEEHD